MPSFQQSPKYVDSDLAGKPDQDGNEATAGDEVENEGNEDAYGEE